MQNIRTYPIKAVSVKTGLSIHVIRVWEKRYQAVTPARTDTNRRLYSDQDIEKLQLLKQATEEGHNIGSVASLITSELKDLLSSPDVGYSSKTIVEDFSDNEISPYVNDCIAVIKNFNALSFEKILIKASIQLSQADLLQRLIIPLIYQIGKLWHNGDIRIMHEHMATAVLKNFLSTMRNNYRVEEGAPSLIVTTPLGQNHEMGALIFAVAAAAEGWNVTYLDPNMPADEIASAALEKKAKAVLLSIVYPADDHYLKLDLQKLGKLLPKKIKVIAGGRLAKNYINELEMINAFNIEDFVEFKKISSLLKKGSRFKH